jgi:putative ABC transport system permease protein
MGVLWYKVWFDLWHYKARTLLAVLSIAAGVFAVGAMYGMSELLLTNMDQSHQAVMPPHINVILGTRADYDTLISLRRVPGVEDVEPYNSVSILYKLHPQDDWRPGNIHMRADFDDQTYELVQLRQGSWPKKNEVGIERMAAQFLKVGIGDQVIFKINDGNGYISERSLPITSLIRHPFVPPPEFMDLAFFFMDSQGLERLGVPAGEYNSFFVRVTPYSTDNAKVVATAIKDRLGKQNIRVATFVYQDPAKHWGRTFFDGFTLVLKLLALICVLMSAVLVYNTVSFLIIQQTNQIGVLKALGGRTFTIIGVYLSGALIYGLLALMIALPLSAMVAANMTRTFLNMFNIDYDGFQVSREALTFQLISALVVPVLAGLAPVLRGANLTVRQAISSYGLGGDFQSGRINRAIEGLGQGWLPPQIAAALGNLFRQKGRLLLTQVVLVTAGSAFLMIMSLNSSLAATLDHIFARHRYDTTLLFRQNVRLDRVELLSRSVAGVDQIELRLTQAASLYVSGQLIKEAGIGTNIEGIPAGSDFFQPLMVDGRWFGAQDQRVVVIPREAAEKHHIRIGDWVTLNLGELGKDTWLVIGTYEPVFASGFTADTIYAPLQALYASTKKQNQGAMLYVRTSEHTPAFEAAVTRQLKDLFEARNLKVVQSQTEAELRQTYEFQFSTVTTMLFALSIIVAIVGGIALTGALSIGVIERTKEIGVLRAIGARSHSILGIFILEGMLQGVLSWLAAVPVSLLFSQPLSNALGHAMFGATLDYQYNWPAVAIWLGVILVISILASILPARSATRISVRDSLAYA